MTPEQYLADWLSRARHARWCTEHNQPWPAWSTGECLAVALILDDAEELDALGYSADEAVDRLRYDLGEHTDILHPRPLSRQEAWLAFRQLRTQLDAEVTPDGANHD